MFGHLLDSHTPAAHSTPQARRSKRSHRTNLTTPAADHYCYYYHHSSHPAANQKRPAAVELQHGAVAGSRRNLTGGLDSQRQGGGRVMSRGDVGLNSVRGEGCVGEVGFMSRQFQYGGRKGQGIHPAGGSSRLQALRKELSAVEAILKDLEGGRLGDEEGDGLKGGAALVRKKKKASCGKRRCRDSSPAKQLDSSSDSSGSDSDAEIVDVKEKPGTQAKANVQNSIVAGVGLGVSSASQPSVDVGNQGVPKVSVCAGKGCCKRGSDALFSAIESGEYGNIAVDRCKCLGLCRNGPAMSLERGGETVKFTNVQVQELGQIVKGTIPV